MSGSTKSDRNMGMGQQQGRAQQESHAFLRIKKIVLVEKDVPGVECAEMCPKPCHWLWLAPVSHEIGKEEQSCSQGLVLLGFMCLDI